MYKRAQLVWDGGWYMFGRYKSWMFDRSPGSIEGKTNNADGTPE